MANEGRVDDDGVRQRNPFDADDSGFEFGDEGHVANVVKRTPQSRDDNIQCCRRESFTALATVL